MNQIIENPQNIYHNITKKRIFNELSKLLSKYKNVNIKEKKLHTNELLFVANIKINNYDFKFILNNNYPFSPPLFMINNNSYEYWTRSPNREIMDLFNSRNCNSACCFFCGGVLCNWTANNNMDSLINEFYGVREIFINILNFFILKKKINNLYPNMCDDIKSNPILTNVKRFLIS